MQKPCTVALFLCIVNGKRMQKRSMNDMDETFHKTNVTLQRKRKNNPKYITTMEKKTTKQQAVEKINNSYSQCNSRIDERVKTGAPLGNFAYDEVRELGGSASFYICSKRDSKGKILYGVIDKEGKELVPCKMNHIDFMFNGYSLLYADNKVGALSSDRKYIAPQFDELENSDVDFLYGRKGDVSGFIDENGEFF